MPRSRPKAPPFNPQANSQAEAQPSAKQEGRLVRTVLRPALGLWLRSQAESVQSLQLTIAGRDRQVFSGQIPQLIIEAEEVVYQGLRLGQLKLVGQNIRMNLGQVLRGKPLKLLEPIRVSAEVALSEADLNASLQSPLLEPLLEPGLSAIATWLASETVAQEKTIATLTDLRLELRKNELMLRANWVADSVQESDPTNTREAIALRAQVEAEAQSLSLTQLAWLEPPPPGFRADLSGCPLASLSLGDVVLESFTIAPGRLLCVGQLTVYP